MCKISRLQWERWLSCATFSDWSKRERCDHRCNTSRLQRGKIKMVVAYNTAYLQWEETKWSLRAVLLDRSEEKERRLSLITLIAWNDPPKKKKKRRRSYNHVQHEKKRDGHYVHTTRCKEFFIKFCCRFRWRDRCRKKKKKKSTILLNRVIKPTPDI